MREQTEINWIEFEGVWEILFKYFDNVDFFKVSDYPFGPNIDSIISLISCHFNVEAERFLEKIDVWDKYESGKLNLTDDFF